MGKGKSSKQVRTGPAGSDEAKGSVRRKSTNNNYLWQTGCMLGLAITAVVARYCLGRFVSTRITVQPIAREVEPLPVATASNGIPTYEEYVRMATVQHWTPVDPVLKLESTIKNFVRIFDVVSMYHNRSDFDQHVSFLEQEIGLLLRVLSRASHRTDIDLTIALSLSIKVGLDVTYRHLKEILATAGEDLMLTRSSVVDDPSHWMYIPLRSLVLLLTARHPHIHIDINAQSIENPLVSAIDNKLYSLLPVFVALGSTAFRQALRTAVSYGDDRAVEALLRLSRGARLRTPEEGIVQCIEEALSVAQQLRFEHIERRLRLALEIARRDDRAIIDTSSLTVVNEFLPCSPNDPSTAEISSRQLGGDPDQSVAEHDQDPSWSGGCSSENRDAELCECAIDRIDIADLDAGRFRRDYVDLNRAVAITGILDTAADWSVDGLLRDFGHIEVVVGSIPYATLFGRKESVMCLREYVQHPTHGMRAFSRRVGSLPPGLGCGWTGNGTNPPLYIFSGPEQEINRALRGRMWQAVQTFRSPTPAAGNRSLADLMFSVRRSSYDRDTDNAHLLQEETFPKTWKAQFFLGPPLSGAPFHHHGPAFNFIVTGQKTWMLLPPSRDIYSNMHPVAWLRQGGVASTLYPYYRLDSAGGRPCIFQQRAGEVLFVPRHWTHQVINTAETIGFAIEV